MPMNSTEYWRSYDTHQVNTVGDVCFDTTDDFLQNSYIQSYLEKDPVIIISTVEMLIENRVYGLCCCACMVKFLYLISFLFQNGTWSTQKAIDVPNKKVDGWALPEMPG